MGGPQVALKSQGQTSRNLAKALARVKHNFHHFIHLRSSIKPRMVCHVKLPCEIPVMVLPNAVLFPQAIMPLRIFEPRYREMLATALETDRIFSIALMKRGWEKLPIDPPVHETVGVGLIRISNRQPDGTSQLLLQGVGRARIVGFRQMNPYRVARIEELQTHHADCVKVDALSAKVSELVQKLSKLGHAPSKPVLNHITSQTSPEQLTDIASDLLLSDAYAKQQLLEALDLRDRLHQLVFFLHQEVQRIAMMKKLQGPGDGITGIN